MQFHTPKKASTSSLFSPLMLQLINRDIILNAYCPKMSHLVLLLSTKRL